MSMVYDDFFSDEECGAVTRFERDLKHNYVNEASGKSSAGLDVEYLNVIR